MARRFPPLNPLRVFEVVARTQNLTTAARELYVTQSAVSRQLATLESYLGAVLFRRERRGVVLTQVGQAYARRIVPAFEDIRAVTDELFFGAHPNVLRLRAYTTFTGKWLIPRLEGFRRQHPDIEVAIVNDVKEVDFDHDDVDLAIQFGNGNWPGVQADFLFPDEIEPVCSPAYLARYCPDGEPPERLLAGSLISSHYRNADWNDWLMAHGLHQHAATAKRMCFSSSVLAWQAAADGLGIAIGQTPMLDAELAEGTLVHPFSRRLRRPLGFYLVRPAEQRHSHEVAAFREWLLKAATRVPET